jgi:hypothetical protein
VSDLRVVPTLDELVADPARAATLPVEAASALLTQCAVEIATYETLREALRLRIASGAVALVDDGEQIIGTEGLGRMLGRGKSWIEHHLDELPERRSLLGAPVWLKRDVEQWIKGLPKYGSSTPRTN